MSWRQNLRPASFRGVTFHVDDRKFSTGRRIHNHEFPKRDSNMPEYMGKKTRTYTVDAYVIGDDYMAVRDRLIAACERNGSGALVDHWGRHQTVVCETCDLTETRLDGRFAKFSLSFLEAGGAGMPIAVAATAAQLVSAASSLISQALASFSSNYEK
jgi:prophage DNA circulation protein